MGQKTLKNAEQERGQAEWQRPGKRQCSSTWRAHTSLRLDVQVQRAAASGLGSGGRSKKLGSI